MYQRRDCLTSGSPLYLWNWFGNTFFLSAAAYLPNDQHCKKDPRHSAAEIDQHIGYHTASSCEILYKLIRYSRYQGREENGGNMVSSGDLFHAEHQQGKKRAKYGKFRKMCCFPDEFVKGCRIYIPVSVEQRQNAFRQTGADRIGFFPVLAGIAEYEQCGKYAQYGTQNNVPVFSQVDQLTVSPFRFCSAFILSIILQE